MPPRIAHRRRCLRALLAPMLGWLAGAALAAPGDVDVTFGGTGTVMTDFAAASDEGRGVAIQPDGKIVVAGHATTGAGVDFAVARYLPSGTLDTGFGSGGKVTTPIGSGADYGRSMVLQPDGKIVVAGYAANGVDDDFALVRYQADGALDATFGSGGKVTTAMGSGEDRAIAVVLQADGRIVLAGFSGVGGAYDYAVARYQADGTLDASFGAGGKVITPVGTDADWAYGMAVQEDGKIVVGGESRVTISGGGATLRYSLVRYLADGTLDGSFGSGGVMVSTVGGRNMCLALQADGRIVMAGYTQGAGGGVRLARFDASGALDGSFGGAGIVDTRSPGGSNPQVARSVVVQGDGKIVIGGGGGNADAGGNGGPTVGFGSFLVARYNATGVLDPGFGTGGRTTVPAGGGSALGMAVGADGKIVLAGTTGNISISDFVTARFEGGDLVTEPPVLTAPATGTHSGNPMTLTFTLPEVALGGSVQLVFSDGTFTYPYVLAPMHETAGTHSFTFDPVQPALGGHFISGGCTGGGPFTVTLSYRDASANGVATSAAATGVFIDPDPPMVPQVNLSTSNPSVAYARAGDSVVLAFTTDEDCQVPEVNIGGLPATLTGGPRAWVASIVVAAGAPPDGYVPFSIVCRDIVGNTAALVTSTTDTSGAWIDTTPPALSGSFSPLVMPAGSYLDSYLYQVVANDASGVTLEQSPPYGTELRAGTTHVTITGTDGAGNQASLGFDVTTQTTMEAWRTQVFGAQAGNPAVAGDLADPNGNGLVNVLEYALGGEALGSGAASVLPVVGRDGGDHGTLAFTRTVSRSDLTLTVRGADAPGGPWTDLARSTSGEAFTALEAGAAVAESGSGDARAVVVSDVFAVGDPAHPRRFLRLEVVR